MLLPGGSEGFLVKNKMNEPTLVRQEETKLCKEKSLRPMKYTGRGVGALALWGTLGEVWVPFLWSNVPKAKSTVEKQLEP